MTMATTDSLCGPTADLARTIVRTALAMTHDQAVFLSQIYETDPNDNYFSHCVIVQDALEITGRAVALGWFEMVFRYQEWIGDTKALHAVADAVMATLVMDVVSRDVAEFLVRPWQIAFPLCVMPLAERATA